MDELIIKYFEGTATLEEKEQIYSWLQQSKNHSRHLQDLQRIWILSKESLEDPEEIKKARNLFKKRIEKEQKDKMNLRLNFFRIAVIFLLVLGFTWWHSSYFSKEKTMKQLVAEVGSKEKFELSDGSVVWLNGGSTLIIPESFEGNKIRNVDLEGEAYFEIKKDKEKPFVVNTRNVNIKVLGTRFNVVTAKGSGDFKTVLICGSIKLFGGSLPKEVMLEPNQKFETKDKGVNYKVKEVKADLYKAWTHSELVFNNASLSDIFSSLESWFQMEFEYPTKLAEETFMSLTIRDESCDEILKSIAVVSPIAYKIEGRKVFVSPSY